MDCEIIVPSIFYWLDELKAQQTHVFISKISFHTDSENVFKSL